MLEPDSNVTQSQELPDRKFKITMINILETLMGKADHMQEYTSSAGRRRGSLRKKEEGLERTQSHSCLHGLTGKRHVAEESSREGGRPLLHAETSHA